MSMAQNMPADQALGQAIKENMDLSAEVERLKALLNRWMRWGKTLGARGSLLESDTQEALGGTAEG
jgi:hypothetical protein